MKLKLGVLAGLTGLVMALGVSTASASSDSCREAGKCTVRTADTHVDLAVIKMDADTAGRYRLTCTKGSQKSVQRGLVGFGERVLVEPELNNSACFLKAKGFSERIARVRGTLIH